MGWLGLWERRVLGTNFALAWGSLGQPLRLGRDIAADQPAERGVAKNPSSSPLVREKQ